MATFDLYSRVKEILIQKEEDMIPILKFLDPNEEIKVTYLHNKYKVSFASETMCVEDVQEHCSGATILSVW